MQVARDLADAGWARVRAGAAGGAAVAVGHDAALPVARDGVLRARGDAGAARDAAVGIHHELG